MRNYRTWLWAAAVFQLLTAFFHSLSFLRDPVPQNETEKTLIDLMANYQQDAMGMMVTTHDIMTALSACFTLVCLLGGWINVYLLRQNAPQGLVKGLISIQLLVFGILFAVMAAFTFPPPIVLTGLIFVCLLPARLV